MKMRGNSSTTEQVITDDIIDVEWDPDIQIEEADSGAVPYI